jgi:hypothetical protein
MLLLVGVADEAPTSAPVSPLFSIANAVIGSIDAYHH